MLQTTISTDLNAERNEVTLYTKADSVFVVAMINSKTPE
jgi:hypothetical protein